MDFKAENTQFWVVNSTEINNEVGDIDLFLLDLILRGEVKNGMKILDAGCGSGRNLFYFLKQGFYIKRIDKRESEVRAANFLSRSLGKGDICLHSSLLNIPFDKDSFDFIVCSRVLHFADSSKDFNEMMAELARVLSPGGVLYLAMDSIIGLGDKVQKVDKFKYQFQDGSIRFALTESLLEEIENHWFHIIDPRTVSFNSQHAETTLVMQKN
jgi:ubiquinone/menaquinone biosynthesis C-methylase UbiE